MGLNHEFSLITYDDYEELGYDGYYLPAENLSNVVLIHDDIIQYIQDTFNWVPSINPAMNYQKISGLCNYGVTLFDKDGAAVIFRLVKAWIDLFSNGPDNLKLTGNYCWTMGDNNGMQDGKYEIIEVAREELIENFRKLQSFAEKVISSSNRYFILHYGI